MLLALNALGLDTDDSRFVKNGHSVLDALLTYQKFVYLMLNKPEGVVSASTDKRDTTGGGSGRGRLPPAGAVPGRAAG